MRVKMLFLMFLVQGCFYSFGQNINILIDKLNHSKSEADKIIYETQLSWEYRQIGNFEKAIEYGESALIKSEKLHYKTGEASACNALGAIYDEKGKYPKSLYFYTRTLKIHEEQGDSAGICRDFNNIGLLYENLANFNTAIGSYEKALKIATRLNNIRLISAINFNIGAIYTYTNKYELSNSYYFKCLEIDQRLKDSISISDCYTNIGINYSWLENYEKAYEYCEMGLLMKKALNDINGVAVGNINISDIYLKQSKYTEAKPYLEKALETSLKTGSADNLKLAYEGLSEVNYKLNNYKEAYDYHVKLKQVTDSLFNSENNEALNQTKIGYELEKKEIEKLQVKAITDADKKQKNVIILGVALLLISACVFSVFLYKKIRITNKQKEIILLQKELVVEKQKEISDSINYAKKIQTSFLANENEFKNYFKDYFILFKPKDIVSGDFYWATSVGSKLFVCIADSTGHGIPGAFMSLLNISLLNEAVLSRNLLSPKEILNFVRKILILGLKPDESGQGGNDGMDCVLFSVDFQSFELTFSGANNPLWILRDGELIELKSDKMPVGRSPRENISFLDQTFHLNKNDSIYCFTDGYADQFGGPKGKKLMYKKLETLIIGNHTKNFDAQNIILKNAFNDWKGDLEQVDDVTVLGFKI